MNSTAALFRSINSFSGNLSDPRHLVERACPLCGHDDASPVLSLRDFQFFSDSSIQKKRTSIQHVQCRRCLCLYMNPCYSDTGFGTFFDEAGMSYGASPSRYDEELVWLEKRGLLAPGTTLLDVGCHLGSFISKLPPTVNAVGVDIDDAAIAQAQARFATPNRRFVAGRFDAFSYEGTVDVITMFHVLEHLPNPLAVLRRLRALSHARTRLVVEVPVLEKAATNDINGFLTVFHLTHFSAHTIESCLCQAGWTVVERSMQDYNGYRLLAAPGETCPTCNVQLDDLTLLHGYLSHWYDALVAADQRLLCLDTPNCVLWGAGVHTELLYHFTNLFRRARNLLLVDLDPQKQGKTWRGVAIAHPDVLKDLAWQDTSLVISSYGHQEAIAEHARSLAVPGRRVLRLYDHIRRY